MSLTGRLSKAVSIGLVLSNSFFSDNSSAPEARATPTAQEAKITPTTQPAQEFSGLETYGTVKFRKNPDAADQLYIVPIVHRNSFTGKIDKELNVPEVGQDANRIARHLIENKNLELILRDGWYSTQDYTEMNEKHRKQIREELKGYKEALMNDDAIIVAALSAEDPDYVPGKPTLDGVYLLHLGYDINIQGVEDEGAHKHLLDLIKNSRGGTQEGVLDAFRIKHANQVRAGEMLRNIPTVVERERKAGRIKNNNALLVIGVGDVGELINYIEENKVFIFDQPHLGQPKVEYFLHLENYGVTVIEPNSLPQEYKIKSKPAK